MTRTDGVTVLTVTSDGGPTRCPLLCQLICMICCCPSMEVFKRLPGPRHRAQSALGALQVMIGLLTIGLGLMPYNKYFYSPFDPVWFGVAFILGGMACILTERFYSSFTIVLSGIISLFGVIFPVVTIVLYGIQVSFTTESNYSCSWPKNLQNYPPIWTVLQERHCEGIALKFMLDRSVLISLITLSCLELCVVFISASLSIKALRKNE